jgi:rubrerythrin
VKLTKSKLRQIIKEEIESVMGSETGLNGEEAGFLFHKLGSFVYKRMTDMQDEDYAPSHISPSDALVWLNNYSGESNWNDRAVSTLEAIKNKVHEETDLINALETLKEENPYDDAAMLTYFEDEGEQAGLFTFEHPMTI